MMKEQKIIPETERDCDAAKDRCRTSKKAKKKWEKPTLEDVSGKVMAQPYIRFT